MRWQGRTGSGNVQDRRGMGMALPVGGGIGGLVLLLLFSALTGQNPVDVITSDELRPQPSENVVEGWRRLRVEDASEDVDQRSLEQ